MIERDLRELPWPAICADIGRLAADEARRAGLPAAGFEDLAQEACLRLHMIATHAIPADLLGEDRPWLRRVIFNCAQDLARDERRWRLGNGQRAAEARALSNEASNESATIDLGKALAGLPSAEQLSLTLLRMHMSLLEIGAVERKAPEEIQRRARWAGVRLALRGALPRHVGRDPGGLASLRGAQRKAAIRLLVGHHWPPHEVSAELRTSASTARRATHSA